MDAIEQGLTLFRIGEWVVDPMANRVRGENGETRVEPKVMAVLVYLAARPGQAVTRSELEAAVWSGVVVSYATVTGAVQKLRKVLDDDPAHPRFIETLSKKGYRLIAPVTPLEATPEGDESGERAETAFPAWTRRRYLPVAVIAVLFLIILAYAWLFEGAGDGVESGREDAPKTIAVLPFRNLTDDASQDYFAEGMSDELIASLARFSNLQVTARDSTAFYRNTQLETRNPRLEETIPSL